MSLLLPFAVFALAAFAQSVTGFGFALIAVPLLAVAADPRSAVVAATVVCLAQTAAAARSQRAEVHWGAARRLLVAASAGMPFGLLVLRIAPAPVLTATIAAVTLACTVLVWSGLQLAPSPLAVAVAGVLCGVLSTSTGTTGPPLVAALQSMGFEPGRFRATLAVVFTATAAVAVAGFAATGVLTTRSLALSLLGLPAALLGARLGDRLAAGLDPLVFRRVVLLILTVGSCAALANAVPA